MNHRDPYPFHRAPLVSIGYQPAPYPPPSSPWAVLGQLIGTAAVLTIFAAAVLGFFGH